MIISNEQVRECLLYLRQHPGPVERAIQASASPEQVTRIKAHLQRLPEIREPIVTRLKNSLPTYEIDCRLVAEKIVGRAIGDSLR